jgi:hypothetical protein
MNACLLRAGTMNVAALVVMLAVGCSKSPAGPSAQETKLRQQLSIPANMPFTDLGVIELSAQVPKQVSFGAGRDCLLTPTVLPDGNLMINLFSEAKTADGKTLSEHSRITVRSGQQCAVTLDGLLVVFTPKLKTE